MHCLAVKVRPPVLSLLATRQRPYQSQRPILHLVISWFPHRFWSTTRCRPHRRGSGSVCYAWDLMRCPHLLGRPTVTVPCRYRRRIWKPGKQKSQHWSPRSRGSHWLGTGIPRDRVFNAEEKPLSRDTTFGRVQAASGSENNPAASRGHTLPGILLECLSEPGTTKNPILDTRKGSSTKEEDGFGPECFFAKRNWKAFAIVGPNDAFSRDQEVFTKKELTRCGTSTSVRYTGQEFYTSPSRRFRFATSVISPFILQISSKGYHFSWYRTSVDCLLVTLSFDHEVKAALPCLFLKTFLLPLYLSVITVQCYRHRLEWSLTLALKDQYRIIRTTRKKAILARFKADVQALWPARELCFAQNTRRLLTKQFT